MHACNLNSYKVFLTGVIESEPDIHSRVIRTLELSSKELSELTSSSSPSKDYVQQTPVYRTISLDYNFPEKKPPRESPPTDGLLKINWPLKYFEVLPSVLIYTVPFSTDWANGEWTRKESSIYDRFARLRNLLAPREIKIIVIAIKVGTSTMEKVWFFSLVWHFFRLHNFARTCWMRDFQILRDTYNWTVKRLLLSARVIFAWQGLSQILAFVKYVKLRVNIRHLIISHKLNA